MQEKSQQRYQRIKQKLSLKKIASCRIDYFYSAGPLSLYFYWLYIRETVPIHRIRRPIKTLSRVQDLLCIIALILILLNIPLRHYFTVDAAGVYSRTNGSYLISLVPNVLIVIISLSVVLFSDCLVWEKVIYISYYGAVFFAGALQTMIMGVSIAYPLVTLSICLSYIQVLFRQDRLRMEMGMKLRHAQVQPHFIANGMASLRQLIRTNQEGANEMLDYLIGYLRESMAFYEAEQMVPIEKELELVENYLLVENIRFSGKIDYTIDYDGISFLVPPFSVQPIVENALRHGIRKKRGDGHLSVEVHTQGRKHIIRVTDDGCGFEPVILARDSKEHLGLINTRERIRYMTRGSLTVKSSIGQGTTVEIRI